MCEIFSALGTILGTVGAAVGGGTAAATTAAITATSAITAAGLGIASSIRASKQSDNQNKAIRDAISNSQAQKNSKPIEQTASQLKENTVNKREITSLRIPLNKNANTANEVNTTTAQTGLNIPT